MVSKSLTLVVRSGTLNDERTAEGDVSLLLTIRS